MHRKLIYAESMLCFARLIYIVRAKIVDINPLYFVRVRHRGGSRGAVAPSEISGPCGPQKSSR